MVIGVPAETRPDEKRVAATPETVGKFVDLGYRVIVENDAGAAAHYADAAYMQAGAELAARADTVGQADVVVKVNAPDADEVAGYRDGAIVIASFAPHLNSHFAAYAAKHLTCVALDLLPRITRAQSADILSSQANLAGYKAILMAADRYASMFPSLMTAAGTVKPAQVVVLGVGVAGLQAIATARRLGAIVQASDLRPAAREQVESLGAKWLDVPMSEDEQARAEDTGGYAWTPSEQYMRDQAEVVDHAVARADIVITTAQIPGRKAPVLVPAATLEKMQPGAVIVDMAVASGGNVEGSELDRDVVTAQGVTLVGVGNIPATVATEASALFSRNIFNFLQTQHNADEQTLTLDRDDALVAPTLIVDAGTVTYQAPPGSSA